VAFTGADVTVVDSEYTWVLCQLWSKEHLPELSRET